jgi:hypothetical protein
MTDTERRHYIGLWGSDIRAALMLDAPTSDPRPPWAPLVEDDRPGAVTYYRVSPEVAEAWAGSSDEDDEDDEDDEGRAPDDHDLRRAVHSVVKFWRKRRHQVPWVSSSVVTVNADLAAALDWLRALVERDDIRTATERPDR